MTRCKHVTKESYCHHDKYNMVYLCCFGCNQRGIDFWKLAEHFCKYYQPVQRIKRFQYIVVEQYNSKVSMDEALAALSITALDFQFNKYSFTIKIDQLIENLPLKFGHMTIEDDIVHLYRCDKEASPLFTGKLTINP